LSRAIPHDDRGLQRRHLFGLLGQQNGLIADELKSNTLYGAGGKAGAMNALPAWTSPVLSRTTALFWRSGFQFRA